MYTKKILILLSIDNTKPETEYINRVREYSELSKGALDFSLYDYSDVTISYERNNMSIWVGEKNIEEYDIVYFKYFRDDLVIASAIAQFLLKKDVKFIDESIGNIFIGTKLLPMTIASLNDVKLPRSWYFPRKKVVDPLSHLLNPLVNIQFPMIIKALKGSFGEAVRKVNNIKEIEEFISEYMSHGFILQKHVENEFTLRIVCFGFKVSSAEKRFVKENLDHGFANKGGNSTTAEENLPLNLIDPQIITQAEMLSKKLKANICGLDFLYSEGKYYFLEANWSPGLNPKTNQGNGFVQYLISY